MLTRVGRFTASHGGTSNPVPISVTIPPTLSVPNSITDLTASPGTTDTILNWGAPDDNNAPITDYRVEYKQSASPNWQVFADGVNTTTTVTINNLIEETSYDFRVAAINAEGQGAFSNIVTVTTNASVPVIPFLHDADTYWLDFTSDENVIEQTAFVSTAAAIEQIAGTLNFVQPTKDKQPLNQTNGVIFNDQTIRHLRAENRTGVTNGSNGWYLAVNCRTDSTNSDILNIARNANAVSSRGRIYVPANRQFGFRAANNDGGNTSWIARGPAITLGQWYTLEVLWDIENDTATFWYDGVEQTLAFGTAAVSMNAFPATDPSEIVLGNETVTAVNSFDGEIQNVIFHDGVPSAQIRQSISTHLTGVRP